MSAISAICATFKESARAAEEEVGLCRRCGLRCAADRGVCFGVVGRGSFDSEFLK